MDLLQQTIKFCQLNHIKPVRSRGQNFLIEEKIYEKIMQVANLRATDIVLEVGPGLGYLTLMMAHKAKEIIAVELDDKLADHLQSILKEQGINKVKIINENILNFNDQILNSVHKYKVVANLPYNITSRFLRKFLSEIKNKPEEMILMLQREVAERLVALPGDMSLLSLSAQYYADVKNLFDVSHNNFWPKPKVDSAVVILKIRRHSGTNIKSEKNIFTLAHAGFASKRKQLQGNLAKYLQVSSTEIKSIFKTVGFSERIRAQELSVENWKKLEIYLRKYLKD